MCTQSGECSDLPFEPGTASSDVGGARPDQDAVEAAEHVGEQLECLPLLDDPGPGGRGGGQMTLAG